MPHFYPSRRSGGRVSIEGPDARHLAGPLRARVGETIAVVDPVAGELLSVRLTSVSAASVLGEVVAAQPYSPEPKLTVTMALALLPAAALEESLARCTELGARAFVLVSAERSVSRAAKPARWTAICREAAMLAGRLTIPAVSGPAPPAEVFTRPDLALLDRAATVPLAAGGFGTSLTLAIGPEGGWSPAELALAGDRTRTLGALNLRADTAAPAALATALAAAAG